MDILGPPNFLDRRMEFVDGEDLASLALSAPPLSLYDPTAQRDRNFHFSSTTPGRHLIGFGGILPPFGPLKAPPGPVRGYLWGYDGYLVFVTICERSSNGRGSMDAASTKSTFQDVQEGPR